MATQYFWQYSVSVITVVLLPSQTHSYFFPSFFLFLLLLKYNYLTSFQISLVFSQQDTLGQIDQSNVETSADPSAQINLRQSSRVIYETFVCRQSHRTKDRTLINVAAENNRNLNITPLKTPRFRSLAP